MPSQQGIRDNRRQFLHQLLQVFFVGLTIGMTRTVVPALAESEFGVPKGSFVLLTAFVVSFGVVKAVMNFAAGALSERIGRKPVLSLDQTAKLDIAAPGERGFALGLDEFAGYLGVAAAGVATGYLATVLAPRASLLAFGLAVIGLALALSVLFVRETLPPRHAASGSSPRGVPEVFALMSWRDRRLAAVSQAGLVEKFVDALVWALYPLFLYGQGVALSNVGWIVGVYGFVWGGSQLLTGRLSDHVGRHALNVWGMWTCGAGVMMMLLGDGMTWWSVSAAVSGLGMGMLYPSLSAAVADVAEPSWRGAAIGIYRFWRDLGYAIGGLAIGVVAHLGGHMAGAFWFVALSMFASGALLWRLGEETNPKRKPPRR
jgi:MFS family permease